METTMFNFARATSRSITRRRTVAAVALSAAFMVLAVPGTGHAEAGGNDKVTLCHLTGNGGYETITVSASGAENGHGKHDGDIIPAPAGGCPTGSSAAGDPAAGDSSAGGADKVTLCHLTGNGSFVTITVSASGAANGHAKHEGDIIPAPASGCPAGSSAAGDKVLVCHLTGNGGYTVINIAQAGWENGHSKHEGDILLLDGAGTESCTDARLTLDAAVAGTAGVAGVDVESLVPSVPDSAPQDGLVTVCHMTTSDGYVKITIAQASWDNDHSKHEGDVLMAGSSASASCSDVASFAPAVPTAAADPVLPTTGSEHTTMAIVAALALLSGLWFVRIGSKHVTS